MTRPPEFDELVGDIAPEERERLRRVHDLLVVAGPPPEIPPEIEAGPTLAMTLGRPRRTHRQMQRRVALLAAAIVVLALVFLGGYITGNDSTVTGKLIKLQGTAVAPKAEASLRLQDPDTAGNWPMQFAALGLPKLPPKGYYEVYLTRNGKIWAPCGTFVVKGTDVGVSVRLNAPYELEPGDSWVVTRQDPGKHTPGPVVLKPLT
jgi:hypothetical protein